MLIYGVKFDIYIVFIKFKIVVDNMVLYNGIYVWLKYYLSNNLLILF